MIKFFRKLRLEFIARNRFSKYMIYAIGEIILVVIGILIALQVNEWNENRKNTNESIKLLKRLSLDLKLDTIFFNRQIIEAQQQVDDYRLFFRKSYDTQNSIDEVTELVTLAYPRTQYLYVQNSTYLEMMNSGKIDYLNNDELKSDIISLYRDYEIARIGDRDYNNFTGRLLDGIKFNIWKFFPVHRENKFTEEFMFQDNEWHFLNDYSSPEFQQFQNVITQYDGKHTAAITMYDSLKVKANSLLRKIDNDLKKN